MSKSSGVSGQSEIYKSLLGSKGLRVSSLRLVNDLPSNKVLFEASSECSLLTSTGIELKEFNESAHGRMRQHLVLKYSLNNS